MIHPPSDVTPDDAAPEVSSQAVGSQEVSSQEIIETQDTQATQLASQLASQESNQTDFHIWGYLQPCNPQLTRLDFQKLHPIYHIGRQHINHITLAGFKVSNKHCTIKWDGKNDRTSCVMVQDLSSNGTFINGDRIGRNQTRLLREGNEIAFGHPAPQEPDTEDYRYIYRHTAAGPASTGMYAFYDVASELGKGSFATVYKAVSHASGMWYAIKSIKENKIQRMPGDDAPGKTGRQNLSREISILESLKHPNVCDLKEVFFEDNGDINLVLELVEGGDLLDYILKASGLSEDMTQHITYQICVALAYIHSKGVTHRDLKPENILLTKDNPPRVKVADFGLAKAIDSLTILRTMCGTPSYLAPEVVYQQPHEGYDNLVDSWSVGVIVFSMLTNASPFIEDVNQPVMRIRIAERRIDWPMLATVNISANSQNFIERLLETNPRTRMSLTDALEHPWLQSYEPVYNDPIPDSSPNPTTRSIPPDVSMLSFVSEEVKSLSVSPSQDSAAVLVSRIPGAFPSDKSNGVQREPSRSLVRRSQVVAAAADGGPPLTEPSWEMVQRISSQDQAAGPSNLEGNKGSKRAHADLSPLSEEVENNADVAARPLTSPRKRGRSSAEDAAPARGVPKIARGKGRGIAVTHGAREEPPTTRRSARTQKARA